MWCYHNLSRENWNFTFFIIHNIFYYFRIQQLSSNKNHHFYGRSPYNWIQLLSEPFFDLRQIERKYWGNYPIFHLRKIRAISPIRCYCYILSECQKLEILTNRENKMADSNLNRPFCSHILWEFLTSDILTEHNNSTWSG